MFHFESQNLVRRSGKLCASSARKQDWKSSSPKAVSHSCDLEIRRCEYKTESGRCRRMTRKQIPYCWQHTRIAGRVVIRQTRGKGLGLFACDGNVSRDSTVFKKGDEIAIYARKKKGTVKAIGEFMTERQSRERYGRCNTEPYAINIKSGKNIHPNTLSVVDTACQRSIGSYANSSSSQRTANAILTEFYEDGEYWLVATKKICNGEEVVWYYGDDYRMSYPAFFKRKVTHRNRPNRSQQCPKSRKGSGRATSACKTKRSHS